MKRPVLAVAAAAAVMLPVPVPRAQAPGVRITYLYDNTATAPELKADWGFASLIESQGRTVLFDTGARPDVLRGNAAALRLDLRRAEALVLSHPHSDHTMGLGALPAMPGVPVYMGEHFRLPPPADAELARLGAKRVLVSATASAEVFPGFLLTNEMTAGGTYELALAVDTPDGSVVVVGCAHPGIVAMLKRVARLTGRPINAVVGGFHLLQTPADEVRAIIAEFKTLGVARVGPTHCTGGEAIRLFREAYGDRFIEGGVGTVIELGGRTP